MLSIKALMMSKSQVNIIPINSKIKDFERCNEQRTVMQIDSSATIQYLIIFLINFYNKIKIKDTE